jgi:hypothetical protein
MCEFFDAEGDVVVVVEVVGRRGVIVGIFWQGGSGEGTARNGRPVIGPSKGARPLWAGG